MTTKPFDEILDECLSLLRAGSTIDECAAVYPEHADELRGQLEVARTMITARPPEQPPEAVRSQSRARLLSAVASERDRNGATPSGLGGFFGSSWGRWTLIPKAIPAVVAMLVLGGAAWGVSAATTGDPNPGTWFASSSHQDRVELRGTISAIDANALTITTADGDVTVQITPDTEFDDDGGAKTGQAAFAVGDVVKVIAVRDATGALIAREVELENNDGPNADDPKEDQPGTDDGDKGDDQGDDHQEDDGAVDDNSGLGSENSGPGNAEDRDDDGDDDNSGPGNAEDLDDDGDNDNSGPGNVDDRDDDDDHSGSGGDDSDDGDPESAAD